LGCQGLANVLDTGVLKTECTLLESSAFFDLHTPQQTSVIQPARYTPAYRTLGCCWPSLVLLSLSSTPPLVCHLSVNPTHRYCEQRWCNTLIFMAEVSIPFSSDLLPASCLF
jgi:hypothetical protein